MPCFVLGLLGHISDFHFRSWIIGELLWPSFPFLDYWGTSLASISVLGLLGGFSGLHFRFLDDSAWFSRLFPSLGLRFFSIPLLNLEHPGPSF